MCVSEEEMGRVMFMCAHVYVTLCCKIVRNVALGL